MTAHNSWRLFKILVRDRYVSPGDLDCLTLLDDPDEVVRTIRRCVVV
jgi:hypothetical protein